MRAGLGSGAAPLSVLIIVASMATSASVRAQVNLPPPPPPPLDNGGSSSSGSSTSGSTGDNTQPSATHKPQKPKKPPEATHTGPPPTAQQPPPREIHHEAPPPPPIEQETPRTTSIRLNPLPIFAGRLSADLEFMLAPHHALIVSPNVTFHNVAFHRNANVLGYGLGFAGDDSAGFGGEVGYHYWVRRHLQGIYLGPSLLIGATLPEGGKTFGYYGAAFDVGYQYLFSNGFTLNGGGGILIINATPAGSTAKAAPRFLFGIGWSF